MTKHIHKYFRTKIGSKGYTIYKCVIPGCTHFINQDLVIGRQSICWRCDNEFTVTKHYKKQHCDDCTRGRVKVIEGPDFDLMKHFEGILEGKL